MKKIFLALIMCLMLTTSAWGVDLESGVSVLGTSTEVMEDIHGTDANSFICLDEASTSINPTMCPDRADQDTGIGDATADNLSLIAGGVEGLRITEAARTIESNATVCADDSGDLLVTTTATHALSVGDVMQFAAGTGALCTGIAASTNYYVTAVDSTTTVNIALTRGGTNITYTDTGTAFTSYEMEVDTYIYGQTILPTGADNGYMLGAGGDTGFYEVTANSIIGVKFGGTIKYNLSDTAIYPSGQSGGIVYFNQLGATTPTFTFTGDIDTGLSRQGADAVSLTAGAIEGIRVTESGSAITTTLNGNTEIPSDSTGGNAGARNQLQGLPKIDLVILGTMTNGSTETTAYIDSDPAGECNEIDAGSNVLITEDTTYYRDDTNSVKIALTATAVAGDGVDCDLPAADDLEANESIGFWIYSDTALTAGDFEIELDDDGASPDWTANVPAISTANKWTWVEIDISGCQGGGGDCDVVDGLKFLMTSQGATNLGAVNVYIDAMYKWDSADEETVGHDLVQDGVLSVLTVVDADGNAHTQARLTEYTDYFIHYQSGNDAIVTITDQSTKSGTALVAYQ
jgi:hypothetical protein